MHIHLYNAMYKMKIAFRLYVMSFDKQSFFFGPNGTECKNREIKFKVQALLDYSFCAATCTCRLLSKAKCNEDKCHGKTRDF